MWFGCCNSATLLSPIGACSVRMRSVVLSSLGEFDESKNITCVSGMLVVFCCCGVTLVAFSAFIVFIFLTILSIFFVDLLKSIFSLVSIALLLTNDDYAMSWGPCVRGLNELVSMKSVGSLLAMISYGSLLVGSASTLNICIDGSCGMGVLKMRKDLFVSVSDVADCSLRVEAVSDCPNAACFAFSLKL